ncbi:hypothetical protein KXD96_27880 [Mycobacterium sp. SMC-2]|uniref:hypothetical protein n=1 Tax=Mycobacterium sp. SMC-2 TaxID=2857058 RepID=UPI0021B1642E|nr:hypothetical protein [Mycobacterium sp. SMC-2]UXA06587.1 hypothetical protein KXD96_27880 [Mycobacterium sp. SMC-2]
MAEYDSFEAAREQAAEYLGFLASDRVKGFEIPNPSLLSDEATVRLAQLDLDVESWDRHPSEFAAPAKEALAEKINHALAAHGDPPADGVAAELVQLVEDFVKNYPGMLMIGAASKSRTAKTISSSSPTRPSAPRRFSAMTMRRSGVPAATLLTSRSRGGR